MEIGEGTKAVTPKLSGAPCAIKSLVVTCGHSRTSNNRLQIVPERNRKDSSELEALGLQVSFDREYGTKEEVSAKVVTMDGSGRMEARCASLPKDGNWKPTPSEFSIKALVLEDCLWPLEQGPTTLVVSGRGCDGTTMSVDVDVFPTDRYTATLAFDPEYELIEKIVKGINKFFKSLCRTTPVDIKLTVQGPSGSATMSWGWEEDQESWKAYYRFTGEFGIDPIFKVGAKVELSLAAAGGILVGMPPHIMKNLGRHLVDILLFVGVAIKGRLTGTVESRTYAVGRAEARGEVTLGLEGTGKLGITIRIGSAYVLSISLTGAGTCGIGGDGKLEVRQAGLFLSAKAEILPLDVYVTVRTRAFRIFSFKKTRTWTVWKGMDLYDSDPHKLWPLKDAKTKQVKGSAI